MASGSPPRRFGGARLRAFGMVLRRAGVTLLFVVAIFLGALSGIFLAYEKDLPQVSTLEDFEPNIITQVYTGDGKLLGEFAIERRVVVGFKDIPPVLRNATIAVEDADFWKHLGVNPWRIPGALLANLRSGKRTQGSSTLTMQLVRQPGLFLTPAKTYERKIKEALLAFELEKTFTKEEIFTYYCNQVYFGHGNYGVEAASEFLFSKSIKDLTLPEAALLAGLPQSPSRLSPVEHADRALQRRNHVLQRMLEEKYISAEEAKAAQAEPLHLSLKREPPSIAPYFLEEVRKYLEKEYGSQRIYQGGLRVYTTLDSATQTAANRRVRDWPRVMDRRPAGAVRAMVGGYDFERSKFNRATQAWRQVGSAFKPFVYAAAIEKAGYTAATIIVDAPVSFPDNNTIWTPHNFDYKFEGPIPMRHALEESRNVPAVKTLEVVGVKTASDYAHKLGLTGEMPPYLPLALGAGEATLVEMTAAYAAFGNEGLRMKPFYITRITDRDGNVIEEARPVARDAIRADTAYLMTSLLKGVVERGTAVKARSLKRPIAGKTGTTNDFTDAWFIGFEPALAAGVWVG